ncbi:MAG TPA: hypothetical protein VMO26_09975 [Vicinamibacterales bacterium]|nr:hypothetical protein [Vicinamibacterales bacterium]
MTDDLRGSFGGGFWPNLSDEVQKCQVVYEIVCRRYVEITTLL